MVFLPLAMEILELLDRLDRHFDSFPTELAAEAVARREEIIPELLNILDDIECHPERWLDNGRIVHIYAFYMLALFRETRAYATLIRLFSRPGEFADDLAGDIVSQDLGPILASVCGGDIGPIKTLIENAEVDEWVRSAALAALVSLVIAGVRERDEIVHYFLHLFRTLKREPNEIWNSLAFSCVDLWPSEVVQELRLAYDDDLVSEDCIDWVEIEDTLAKGRDQAMASARIGDPLIDDLQREMSWMSAFQPPEKSYTGEGLEDILDEDALLDELEEAGDLPLGDQGYFPEPYRRTFPKVGRNEPCPCGSGKKYKKCCGSIDIAIN